MIIMFSASHRRQVGRQVDGPTSIRLVKATGMKVDLKAHGGSPVGHGKHLNVGSPEVLRKNLLGGDQPSTEPKGTNYDQSPSSIPKGIREIQEQCVVTPGMVIEDHPSIDGVMRQPTRAGRSVYDFVPTTDYCPQRDVSEGFRAQVVGPRFGELSPVDEVSRHEEKHTGEVIGPSCIPPVSQGTVASHKMRGKGTYRKVPNQRNPGALVQRALVDALSDKKGGDDTRRRLAEEKEEARILLAKAEAQASVDAAKAVIDDANAESFRASQDVIYDVDIQSVCPIDWVRIVALVFFLFVGIGLQVAVPIIGAPVMFVGAVAVMSGIPFNDLHRWLWKQQRGYWTFVKRDREVPVFDSLSDMDKRRGHFYPARCRSLRPGLVQVRAIGTYSVGREGDARPIAQRTARRDNVKQTFTLVGISSCKGEIRVIAQNELVAELLIKNAHKSLADFLTKTTSAVRTVNYYNSTTLECLRGVPDSLLVAKEFHKCHLMDQAFARLITGDSEVFQ